MPKIVIDTDSPEYEERMKAARERAEWELGDRSWAGVLVGAFLYPDDDQHALEVEKSA